MGKESQSNINNRIQLMKTLNKLVPPEFNAIVFAINPPKGTVAEPPAPQADRVYQFLRWAESPTGCGLNAVQDMLKELEEESEEKNRELAKLINLEVQEESKGNEREYHKLKGISEKINEDLDSVDYRIQRFNDCIRQINFDEAKDIFDGINRRYQRRGGNIVFLMQDSGPKKGDIYLEYIIDTLKKPMRDFRQYPIGLSSDMPLDEIGLLDRMATHFGISQRDERTINNIITKIVGSIRSGTILFFHFSGWDGLANHAETLRWLVENFWQPLLDKVSELCKDQEYCEVKVIAVIDSPGVLSDKILNLPCIYQIDGSNINQINEEKVIPIPLRNWEEKEISDWISIYTEIKDKERIKFQTQIIYNRSSRGIPRETYVELEKLWFKYSNI